MRRALLLTLLLLACAGPLAADDPELPVVPYETAHYRIQLEGSKVEAEEAGLVLEAAYKGLAAWFGKEPDLEKGERLEVRYLATRASWEAAMRADGLTPPTDAGGYYSPGNRTLYMFRQPTEYFTRVLLVHEATHQFHFLARTRNKAPSARWYTEGLAEFLSWHQWDGETMVLGVRPWVTLKDHAKVALEKVQAESFDLKAMAQKDEWAGYPASWALFRYLATGRKGKPLKGFETFCRKMDRGGTAGSLFKNLFGGAKKVRGDFVAWLEAEQQPWAHTFNQWEDLGEGRMRGHAGVVSFCRLKQNAKQLEAKLELPADGAWRAGLLLHFVDSKDYVVALADHNRNLHIDRRSDGRWKRLATYRIKRQPPGRMLAWEARRTGAGVSLTVAGKKYGPWNWPTSSLGLAVDSSDLRFHEVSWRLTKPRDRGK